MLTPSYIPLQTQQQPLASATTGNTPAFSPPIAQAAGPAGIAGWLLLLVIKLCASTAGRGLLGIAALPSPVAIANVIAATLAGVSVVFMLQMKRKGVTLAKYVLALDVIYYGLQLLFHSPSDGSDASGFPYWYRPLGFLAASVFYLLYLFKSKRVANTFMR
jgi:hypothetical protein